jgi:hypothetical protein
MTTPEVIERSSRSEGAKKMWEKRRAKQNGDDMQKTETKFWVFHAEWITYMVATLSCFLFVHHENTNLGRRLDQHMTDNNRRSDEIVRDVNKRADDLHKEFYALLKEMKK